MFLRALCVLCGVAAFLIFPIIGRADSPPPRPTRLPTPLPGGGMLPVWMTPPAPGPTRADAGALVYYERCMACHGDKGQGLTTEWRAQWDVEHQDCARSTCHGPRHPPEGFAFPRNFAPALVGAGALARFDTAQSLYDFISHRMPYQAPGSLTAAEYWQLVAFILKRNNPDAPQVSPENARTLVLHPAAMNFEPPLLLGIVGVCVIGGGLLVRRLRGQR